MKKETVDAIIKDYNPAEDYLRLRTKSGAYYTVSGCYKHTNGSEVYQFIRTYNLYEDIVGLSGEGCGTIYIPCTEVESIYISGLSD